MGRVRALWIVWVLLTVTGTTGSAQFTPFGQDPYGRRPRELAKVVMGNVAIGGVSAALRALVNGSNVPKAFVAGAVGGAVHVSGKMISMGNGTASPISGMLVSSIGASMVGNAARGKAPFDELLVPVGFLRVRITPHAASHTKLSVCLFDIASLAALLSHSEVDVDWNGTARAGTFAFTTPYKIVRDGDRLAGVQVANMYVLSTLWSDQPHIRRHEYVHVQQYLFVQEVWGRPMDDFVRARFKLWRRLPRWLEPGFGEPVIYGIGGLLFRKNSPIRRSIESEAEALSR